MGRRRADRRVRRVTTGAAERPRISRHHAGHPGSPEHPHHRPVRRRPALQPGRRHRSPSAALPGVTPTPVGRLGLGSDRVRPAHERRGPDGAAGLHPGRGSPAGWSSTSTCPSSSASRPTSRSAARVGSSWSRPDGTDRGRLHGGRHAAPVRGQPRHRRRADGGDRGGLRSAARPAHGGVVRAGPRPGPRDPGAAGPVGGHGRRRSPVGAPALGGAGHRRAGRGAGRVARRPPRPAGTAPRRQRAPAVGERGAFPVAPPRRCSSSASSPPTCRRASSWSRPPTPPSPTPTAATSRCSATTPASWSGARCGS